jgi:hypothetical protein
MNNMFLEARNLGNVENSEEELPASLVLKSNAMGEGSIDFDIAMNLLKDIPDFDANIKIEAVDLPQFNNFTEAYANFDIAKGKLNFYSESKARDGQLDGYVKPVIENLKLTSDDKNDPLLKKIYEAAIGLGSELIENKKKNALLQG